MNCTGNLRPGNSLLWPWLTNVLGWKPLPLQVEWIGGKARQVFRIHKPSPPPPQHDKAVTAWGRRLVWRLSIPAPVERNDILYAWKCLTNRMRTSKYYSDLPEVPRKGVATPSRLNGWSVIMGDEYWLKEFWYHRLDMTSYYQKTVRVMNAIIRTKFCLNVVKILIFTVYDINTH